MSLATGSLAVVDDIYSYQQRNRDLTHFRGATAPAAAQPGSIFSDSDDDRLYHAGAASAQEEVLQLTRSKGSSPQFASLRLMDTNASHYLSLVWNEDRSAAQTLNIVTGAADRTVTLSGNATLNQDVHSAASPTFANVGVGAATPASGAGLSGPVIHLKGSGPELRLQDDTGTLADFSIFAYEGTLRFLEGGANYRLYFLAGGTILVGATSAIGSELFRVDGNAYFDHDVSALTFTDRV